MTKEPIPTCLSTILKETGRQKVIIETKNKSYRALRHENNTGNLQPGVQCNKRKSNPRSRFLDFLVDLFVKYV